MKFSFTTAIALTVSTTTGAAFQINSNGNHGMTRTLDQRTTFGKIQHGGNNANNGIVSAASTMISFSGMRASSLGKSSSSNEESENKVEATTTEGSDEESADESSDDTPQETSKVLKFLDKKFPSLSRVIPPETKQAARSGPVTIFAPTEAAFEELGSKKLSQLKDPRNAEIVEKLAGYHMVAGSAVTAVELMTEDWTKGRPKDGSKPNTVIAGVMTMSGEVPVGREKTGGILGFAAKETGEIVVGPGASIIQSYIIGDSIVHEMDALVSPDILWRYCDQLQIKVPMA